jgi:uncharacterized protein YidB (DUF937 family)
MDLLNKAMADADQDGMPDAAKVVGGLLGQFGAAATGGDTSPSVTGALAGIGPLVEQLKQAGLADQVASWVSNGPNKPVDAQALGAALPADKLGGLAKQLGLPIDQLLPVLAAALPTVINALTPDEKVPDASSGIDIGGVLGGLGGLLGGNRN